MNIKERHARQLHYDVMGIALAIRGHAGEGPLFGEVDQALAELDWRRIAAVQQAFDMLGAERQRLLMGHEGDPEAIATTLAMFTRNLRTIVPPVRQETA